MEQPSPNSRSCTSSTTTSSTTIHHPHISRSDPYPTTTFVQADPSSFKQVVQMLTGSTDHRSAGRPDPTRHAIPPFRVGPRKDKSGYKLYERRNGLRNFDISPLGSGTVHIRQGLVAGYSGSPRPGMPEILSPSMLNFPSLALSPVTPLIPDPFNRGNIILDMAAEDKAINEKGFYLHPSPGNTPRGGSEPRLLPLFPVTSPRVAGSSTAAES